jgi:hypothetical protein
VDQFEEVDDNVEYTHSKDMAMMENDDTKDYDDGENGVDVDCYDADAMATTVGWFRQLWVICWYKNIPLLMRKPVYALILMFSGVASVLLAWPAGRDPDPDDVLYPPYTDCGTIPDDYVASLSDEDIKKIQLSLNENWRDGLPVAILSLGPLMFAIISYMIVHEELQLHMLGILRGLGTPDSVYWASWYLPLSEHQISCGCAFFGQRHDISQIACLWPTIASGSMLRQLLIWFM